MRGSLCALWGLDKCVTKCLQGSKNDKSSNGWCLVKYEKYGTLSIYLYFYTLEKTNSKHRLIVHGKLLFNYHLRVFW